MITQGGSSNIVTKQIRKAMSRYPETFNKYNTPANQIIDKIIKQQ